MSPAYLKESGRISATRRSWFDKFHVVSQVVQAVEECARKRSASRRPAREQVGTNQLVVAQESGAIGRLEKEARWEQLKDKPLVTGLAYCDAIWSCSRRMPLGRSVVLAAVSNPGVVGANRGPTFGVGIAGPMLKAAEMVERHLKAFWTLEAGIDHSVPGRTQQFVLGDQTQSSRYRSTE